MQREEIAARAKAYIEAETEASFRAEVEALLDKGDFKELEDRFWRDLEFGTGGLRGMIGGGSNRMNTLVVRRATQGLAAYVKKAKPGKALSAAIAYDSRRYSDVFALDAALVLAGNGIKTYLFTSLRPTPVLSFAVRKLGCDTGIVVTASHNPPAYNGYKAYWDSGAQVIEPHDVGIIDEVGRARDVRSLSKEEALAKGLLVMVDKEIDDAYAAMVKAKLFRPELIRREAKGVRIVYTPLHGTGGAPLTRVLGELGLDVIPVAEQFEPDGSFPTVSYPNPEEAAALKLALELGAKVKADVVMATDPDADRLGIAVPDGAGGFALITGNQLGSLLLDYILLSRKELGSLPRKPACVKSIVTTGFQDRIAASYGCKLFACLTGFKWIAEEMRKFETDGQGYEFVFGTEESYGYLVETEVRDKDGVSAAAMTAEMTLYWRSKGKSLLDRMEELFREHGYFEELAISKTFPGSDGMQKMASIMEGYRARQPKAIGGIAVESIADIKAGKRWKPGAEAAAEPTGLPSSDVIQWSLVDGTVVTVRPSGTEPKIKFYASCRADASKGLDAAKAEAKDKLKRIEADIRTVVG
jgi:phosphoglucomutase